MGAGDAGRLPDSVWPGGRAEADLAAFFGGLDLLPPGITGTATCCAASAVKPYPQEAAWMR